MPLEIEEKLRPYVKLSEDGSSIKMFVCPVEGCGYTNPSAGAVKFHMLSIDDEAHKEYEPKLTREDVRKLSSLPRAIEY